MENITSSFARDWQFVKISRNWKPHDFSREVLERIIEENDRAINEKIKEIAYDIGRNEGKEIKSRLGAKIDIKTVIEGILLISGQEYAVEQKNDRTEITIVKKKNTKESPSTNYDLLSIPYIKGVIKSIIPESQFYDNSENTIIYF